MAAARRTRTFDPNRADSRIRDSRPRAGAAAPIASAHSAQAFVATTSAAASAAYAGPAVEAGAPAPIDFDAYAALRADLAARADAGARAAAGDARAEAPDDPVRAAAWLPLVAGLERAARLTPRERPAHFRRQEAAWAAAAEALGEPRYGRVGGRLARWRAPDPRLPLVKELLWALEQPEALGYTRLALAGMTALGRLVPGGDVRAGYVLAQSARAVRTLGDLEDAAERYAQSERLARGTDDSWLLTRSAIGLGSTCLHLGNYPAARAAYGRVLSATDVDPRLTAAAHQGLMIALMAAKDWDAALEKGWQLLQAEKTGAVFRTEALNLTAELCRRIGRHGAATRLAELALREAVRPDQTIQTLQILVDVAVTTGDVPLAERYGPLLRGHAGRCAGPFEDARALLSLAGLEYAFGSRAIAEEYLAQAQAISVRCRYYEVQFDAERLAARFAASAASGADAAPLRPEHDEINLNGHSRYIVDRLDSGGKPGALSNHALQA